MNEQDIREWLKETRELLNEAQEDDKYNELELEIEILEAILKWDTKCVHVVILGVVPLTMSMMIDSNKVMESVMIANVSNLHG